MKLRNTRRALAVTGISAVVVLGLIPATTGTSNASPTTTWTMTSLEAMAPIAMAPPEHHGMWRGPRSF
jgi:hypothetical protein